jgi:DNA helicase IV
MPMSAKKLLKDLFINPNLLAQVADSVLTKTEQKILIRSSEEGKKQNNWSNADIALLDEANDLLGSKEITKYDSKKQSDIQYIEDMLKGYEEKADDSDLQVDIDAEYLQMRLEGLYDLSQQKNNTKKIYSHIIVDEAQELTPMQWRMITRRSFNRSMTIVGDLAQSRTNFGEQSWENFLKKSLGHSITIRNLTKNYRIPKKIMDFAQDFGKKNGLGVTPVESVKTVGQNVKQIIFSKNSCQNVTDENIVGSNTSDLLNKNCDNANFNTTTPNITTPNTTTPNTTNINKDDSNIINLKKTIEKIANDSEKTTIVCPKNIISEISNIVLPQDQKNKTENDILLSSLSILPAEQTKGLEFDNVIIVNPKDIQTSDLYVAMTRTTKTLTIIEMV